MAGIPRGSMNGAMHSPMAGIPAGPSTGQVPVRSAAGRSGERYSHILVPYDESVIFREVREYRDPLMERGAIVRDGVFSETWRIMKEKWYILLTIITWLWGILPAIALVLLQVSTEIGGREGIFRAGDFYDFYNVVFVFVVLHCGYICGKSITSNMADRSITLYLCRPITKLDYLILKFLILVLALTVLIIVPNAILFVLVLGILRLPMRTNLEHLWVLGSIFLYGAMIVSVFALICLAIASSTKKMHWALAGIVSFLFLTTGLSFIMRETLRSDLPALISPWDNLRQVGAPLFALDLPYEFPWAYSFAVLAVTVGISLVVLLYNISRVEVVG